MPEPQAIAAPALNDNSSGSGTSVLAGTLQIFRMAAMLVVAVDLDRHLLAELLPSGPALIALRAALIVMHHHALADPRLPGIDGRADRDHDAARLVPDNDGTVLGLNPG